MFDSKLSGNPRDVRYLPSMLAAEVLVMVSGAEAASSTSSGIAVPRGSESE
jgi:hypothetical protein